MATPKRRISHARTHNRKAKFLGALSAPELRGFMRNNRGFMRNNRGFFLQ